MFHTKTTTTNHKPIKSPKIQNTNSKDNSVVHFLSVDMFRINSNILMAKNARNREIDGRNRETRKKILELDNEKEMPICVFEALVWKKVMV